MRRLLWILIAILTTALVVLVLRFAWIGHSGTASFISLIPTFLLMFILGWSLAVLSGFVTAYFPDMQHLAEVGLQLKAALDQLIAEQDQ